MMKKFKIAFDFLMKPHLFKPTLSITHFSQIETLVQKGQIEIEAMFIDKDDTITAYREFVLFDEKIRNSLQGLRKKDIKLSILSNGIKQGDPLELEEVKILKTKLKKPFNGQEVLQSTSGSDKSKIWVVGDRLMTDIYLANLMGCNSILVSPLQPTSIEKHGLAVFVLRNIQDYFMKTR